MHRALEPGSRQLEIIDLVARHGPMTLVQMSSKIGLATTSMRQQIGRLVSEGWLGRTRRHGKPGRPADVFALSDQSRRLFARQTDEFARSLLQEIAETEGRSKLRAVIKAIGRRMTAQWRPRIGEGTQKERVDRLAKLLSEAGALNDVTRSKRGVMLTIHTCPYHGLSESQGAICEMERDMVSRLVGAKTRLKQSMSDGHARCELEVAVGAQDATMR